MENASVQIFEQSSECFQISEQSSKHKQLEDIIRKMFAESVKELCNESKSEKKHNPSSDILMRPKPFVSIQRPDDAEVDNLALVLTEPSKQFGRKTKNPVVGEKVVCLDIPQDFDVEGTENIEEIKGRLGKWRIQRRQRESKMKDTFYCHLSSRHTFRSIPEVMSFIMRGPKAKPGKKRKASDDDDQASTRKGERLAAKRARKDKGKLVSTSRGFIDQNTTDSNLEHSIIPWRPLEIQMNMCFCRQCSGKFPLNPKPLSIVRCEPKPELARDKNKLIIHENHNFIDLTQDSSVENGTLDSDSDMSEVTQDKVDNTISDESPLKREGEDMKELVDIQKETVEDETYCGLGMLDEYKNLLGDTTFDELVRETNDNNNNVIRVSPPANATDQENIGKEKFAEKQDVIVTITAPAVESSNKQNKNSQDNKFGAAENITSVEEAMQKLPHVELEGVGEEDDDEFYHFQQHAAYFSDERDPSVKNVSIYDYLI